MREAPCVGAAWPSRRCQGPWGAWRPRPGGPSSVSRQLLPRSGASGPPTRLPLHGRGLPLRAGSCCIFKAVWRHHRPVLYSDPRVQAGEGLPFLPLHGRVGKRVPPALSEPLDVYSESSSSPSQPAQFCLGGPSAGTCVWRPPASGADARGACAGRAAGGEGGRWGCARAGRRGHLAGQGLT